METKEIFQIATLGSASTLDGLDVLIFRAAKRSSISSFQHFAPVAGTPSSTRVLAAAPFPDSVPCPRPLTSWDVAKDLLRLIDEGGTRYEKPPQLFMQKGWSVMSGILHGQAVVVVVAVWV